MKIQPYFINGSRSFRAAYVNITALSDTHGLLMPAESALDTMLKNQDVFLPEKTGNKNVLALCGDWFMNGAEKGFRTNPEKPLAFFQKEILNEFIIQVKSAAKNTAVFFTPGNHEFDGGTPLLDKVLSDLNAEIIMTNLDINKSPAFAKTNAAKKLVNQAVLTVDDTKDKNLKHKILFLGISPVNLIYYQKKLDGVKMINCSSKPQAAVNKEDYIDTLNDCKSRIEAFKKENPKGTAVVLCHTGVNFADELASIAPVDLIFDGHEHKNSIRISNKTPIASLSMNFKKLVNAKLKIDDTGVLQTIELQDIKPEASCNGGAITDLYQKLFKDDIQKEYTVKSARRDITKLDTAGVRTGNNYLANFITDSILNELKKQDSSINFFALNSSAIRHPINVSEAQGISRMDIINVLSGINNKDGQIIISDVTGGDIVYMILDNFLFNAANPEKNPLVQYAGLILDKTGMLKAYEEGASVNEMCRFARDKETKKPLEYKKIYRIGNTVKYFNKQQNPKIKELLKDSYKLGTSVQEIFMQSFENSGGELEAECDERIY